MEALSYDDLLALIRQLQAQVAALTEENARLRAEIDRLQSRPPSPPPGIKPSRPERAGEPLPRKRRSLSFARPRETPTRVVEHRLGSCPDCGGPVSAGYEKRRRQVIELPAAPMEITDHVLFGHWCGYCGKEQVASVSAEELGAPGAGRLGARLRSLVVLLRTEGRLPLRTIQRLLGVQYGVKISVGELAEILHAAAQAGEREVEAILEQVRAAPVVHADETGWREDGRNGYLWSFSTPDEAEEPVRYYRYEPSRAGAVVEAVLGETFEGVLVSDFYSAYGVYLGPHQRCWVHLLRDLRALRDQHPDDAAVRAWAQAVKAVYETAKAWQPEHPGTRWEEKERLTAQRAFEERLMGLARPFLTDPTRPQHVLAKRIERFRPELFVFVADPRVPSDNNAAERSLRPSVIARKISGGTRSEAGSATRTTLMTLFGTWKLQGQDLLEACRRMLLTTAGAPRPASAESLAGV